MGDRTETLLRNRERAEERRRKEEGERALKHCKLVTRGKEGKEGNCHYYFNMEDSPSNCNRS